MPQAAEHKTKSVSRGGYGILNKDGQFWSRELYDTPEAAKAHFDAFWKSPGFQSAPAWSDYTVVKARQTITYRGPAVPNGENHGDA